MSSDSFDPASQAPALSQRSSKRVPHPRLRNENGIPYKPIGDPVLDFRFRRPDESANDSAPQQHNQIEYSHAQTAIKDNSPTNHAGSTTDRSHLTAPTSGLSPAAPILEVLSLCSAARASLSQSSQEIKNRLKLSNRRIKAVKNGAKLFEIDSKLYEESPNIYFAPRVWKRRTRAGMGMDNNENGNGNRSGNVTVRGNVHVHQQDGDNRTPRSLQVDVTSTGPVQSPRHHPRPPVPPLTLPTFPPSTRSNGHSPRKTSVYSPVNHNTAAAPHSSTGQLSSSHPSNRPQFTSGGAEWNFLLDTIEATYSQLRALESMNYFTGPVSTRGTANLIVNSVNTASQALQSPRSTRHGGGHGGGISVRSQPTQILREIEIDPQALALRMEIEANNATGGGSVTHHGSVGNHGSAASHSHPHPPNGPHSSSHSHAYSHSQSFSHSHSPRKSPRSPHMTDPVTTSSSLISNSEFLLARAYANYDLTKNDLNRRLFESLKLLDSDRDTHLKSKFNHFQPEFRAGDQDFLRMRVESERLKAKKLRFRVFFYRILHHLVRYLMNSRNNSNGNNNNSNIGNENVENGVGVGNSGHSHHAHHAHSHSSHGQHGHGHGHGHGHSHSLSSHGLGLGLGLPLDAGSIHSHGHGHGHSHGQAHSHSLSLTVPVSLSPSDPLHSDWLTPISATYDRDGIPSNEEISCLKLIWEFIEDYTMEQEEKRVAKTHGKGSKHGNNTNTAVSEVHNEESKDSTGSGSGSILTESERVDSFSELFDLIPVKWYALKEIREFIKECGQLWGLPVNLIQERMEQWKEKHRKMVMGVGVGNGVGMGMGISLTTAAGPGSVTGRMPLSPLSTRHQTEREKEKDKDSSLLDRKHSVQSRDRERERDTKDANATNTKDSHPHTTTQHSSHTHSSQQQPGHSSTNVLDISTDSLDSIESDFIAPYYVNSIGIQSKILDSSTESNELRDYHHRIAEFRQLLAAEQQNLVWNSSQNTRKLLGLGAKGARTRRTGGIPGAPGIGGVSNSRSDQSKGTDKNGDNGSKSDNRDKFNITNGGGGRSGGNNGGADNNGKDMLSSSLESMDLGLLKATRARIKEEKEEKMVANSGAAGALDGSKQGELTRFPSLVRATSDGKGSGVAGPSKWTAAKFSMAKMKPSGPGA